MSRPYAISRTALITSLLSAVNSFSQSESVDTVYCIPQIHNVAVDGSADDWVDEGFGVEVMADVDGLFRTPDDFDPRLRLGWNKSGLLVLIQVSDDGFAESDIDRRLFMADSVELFVGTARDAHDYLMLVIAPGMDPQHPEPRHIFFDERDGGPVAAGTLPELHAQVEVLPFAGGYTIEALIPWSNLDLVPRDGMTLAFQAYAMDRDPMDSGSEPYRAVWYPAADTHQNQTASMMTLELSESPSKPVRAVVRGRYRDIEVVAHEPFTDATLRVERRGEPVAETTLTSESGRAVGTLRLPPPPPGEYLGQLEVFLDDQLLETIQRGNAAAMMGTAFEEGKLTFFQHVFSGPTFPQVEFENARLVEDLIGPFKLITRYYGPELQEVATANAPGRYGVVVTVKPTGDGGQGGRHLSSRFFTLFRTPEDQTVVTRRVPPWVIPDLDAVTLPGGLTLTPEVQADEATLDENDAVRRASKWDQSDTSGDSGRGGMDADLADKTWWVNFKRLYYGLTELPARIPLPRLLAPGDQGRELREGTPEEAGLDPGVIESLDSICDRWAASNKEQGFTICAARHGVAFFHRAYGQDNGTSMTVASPGLAQSVSKSVTGTVFMMYMDHGLIDLDAPIGTYLPLYQTIKVNTPFTIRMLLTHTSGLNGHFGDEQHDLEERIADEYPLLKIPVAHLYSGRGFALAVKALETISAEAFPDIYDHVLIKPLGMENTTVIDSHNRVYTTAWDLAKMGQLMLNGGTYGKYRYFSPITLEQAKPQPMVEIFGPKTKRSWGIGFWGSRESDRHMFSDTAFGHNSGNSSFFRVDPATDLVFTAASLEDSRYMTDAMRREFIEAIEMAMTDTP